MDQLKAKPLERGVKEPLHNCPLALLPWKRQILVYYNYASTLAFLLLASAQFDSTSEKCNLVSPEKRSIY